MIARLFPVDVVVFLVLAGLVALACGVVLAKRAGASGRAVVNGVEALAVTVFMGAAAHASVQLLLIWGGDTQAAALLAGWVLLVWPGIVDTVLVHVFGQQPLLTNPTALA